MLPVRKVPKVHHSRLNAYRTMWLFVFFDLPTTSKKEQKAASKFRKSLLANGFMMMQYSVYIRHCMSREHTAVHVERVKKLMPNSGHVTIVKITDKQYGDSVNLWGRETDPLPPAPVQLEIF